MKHLRSINENQTEYLLVMHHESSDEIHFHVLDIQHLPQIESLIGTGHPGDVDSNGLSDYVNQNEIEHLMCQTYVLEDYPFNKYNFSKVIYIPDLGF
jgi:hypothetical protein